MRSQHLKMTCTGETKQEAQTRSQPSHWLRPGFQGQRRSCFSRCCDLSWEGAKWDPLSPAGDCEPCWISWSEISPSLLFQGAELAAGDAVQTAPCTHCGTVQGASGVLGNCQQHPEQGGCLHPRGKWGLPASATGRSSCGAVCWLPSLSSYCVLALDTLICHSLKNDEIPFPVLSLSTFTFASGLGYRRVHVCVLRQALHCGADQQVL